MQLGVADPVPTLEAPPVSRLSKQGLWACAEAGFTNVLRSLLRSQRPGEVTARPDLLIHCKKRDLALPLEWTLDLAMQSPSSRRALMRQGSPGQ
jgi:hypothetical protein